MNKRINNYQSGNGYNPGHPWYYLLGGTPPYPKAILTEVIRRGYRGYLEGDIATIDNKQEPKRSESLRMVRAKILIELKNNLASYRAYARQLSTHRNDNTAEAEPRKCCDIHQSVSLKHNHLYNDLAHLVLLDDLFQSQPDLFA